MAKISLVILSVLLVAITTIDATPKRDRNDYTKNPFRIVCYFGSWANYHKVDPFKIEDIDSELCTHVNYGFAKLNEYSYEIEVFDPYLDDKKNTWDLRGYERFNNLRKKNPNLTTMISLGGWYEGSEKYSDMAKSATKRHAFVQSVLKFLKEHDFDGLDMDWEYPGSRLGDPVTDKEDFILLLRELKTAFEPEGYVLTAAVSPGKKTIDAAYNVPELNKLFDWINIMAYDYHGGWEDQLGHNAPLYKREDETDEISFWFNVNYTINYYLQLGADKKKMVMGLPFYGRAWSLMSDSKIKLHDEAKGMSPAGFISGEEGVLGYNEICQMELNNTDGPWENHYDEYYNAPFAWNKKIWVGFDNRDSLSCKLAFLKEMGLSGGMVWSLENDDFKNRCGGGKNPLLHKVHEMLNGAGRDSFECIYGGKPTRKPTTTTPRPTTTEPTTRAPTTTEPTTKAPTTTEPTTRAPTTTEPTTRAPTTQEPTTTRAPTTQQPTTTQEPTTEEVKVTKHDGPVVVKCTRQGKFPHPTDRHKYIVCEYIAEGASKGWWIHIMGCPPGTRWHQPLQNCIEDDGFLF